MKNIQHHIRENDEGNLVIIFTDKNQEVFCAYKAADFVDTVSRHGLQDSALGVQRAATTEALKTKAGIIPSHGETKEAISSAVEEILKRAGIQNGKATAFFGAECLA
jgi:hypothetical protein